MTPGAMELIRAFPAIESPFLPVEVTCLSSLHDRHFSDASTGRPAPEPIPEEIVSNRGTPQAAALVPAQSDLMACSKMHQIDAVARPGDP